MQRLLSFMILAVLGLGLACRGKGLPPENRGTLVGDVIKKADNEWKQDLPPETYQVMRMHGTEKPFTGEYWDQHADGKYVCAACGFELFASDAKFDSGTGWPSFDKPLADDKVSTTVDASHGMQRTEVHCPRCGGHLGHLFDDGPRTTTGMRYCINSCSLKFMPKDKK